MYLSALTKNNFCNALALGSQAQSSEIKLSYVRKKLCTKSQEFSHAFRAFDVLLARSSFFICAMLSIRGRGAHWI